MRQKLVHEQLDPPMEALMTDHKLKIGEPDVERAARQDDATRYLALHTGISPHLARDLIRAYGSDLEKLMKAARGLAGSKPSPRSSRV